MYMTDGNIVRKLMLEQNLTMRELSEKAGVTETTASRFFHADARTHSKTVNKIAAALGVKPVQILKKE